MNIIKVEIFEQIVIIKMRNLMDYILNIMIMVKLNVSEIKCK